MRLIRCLALVALGLMIVAVAPAAHAIDAVSVRSDAPAIDLTAVLDHQRSETDLRLPLAVDDEDARRGAASSAPSRLRFWQNAAAQRSPAEQAR